MTDPTMTAFKVNSAKHRAKITFTGADDRPGVTFECKRDAEPFTACTSPTIFKRLRTGQHAIKVRAVDVTGNPDGSPLVKSFKIRP